MNTKLEEQFADFFTQLVDHDVLVKLHKIDKPDSPIIEVEPYTLKSDITEVLDQYIEHQDFYVVDSPLAERLTIVVNNPILFSELVFKYPEFKQLT